MRKERTHQQMLMSASIYSEVKETIVGDKTPDFARTIVIEGGKNDGGITRTLNSITYKHYNLKREKKNPIK